MQTITTKSTTRVLHCRAHSEGRHRGSFLTGEAITAYCERNTYNFCREESTPECPKEVKGPWKLVKWKVSLSWSNNRLDHDGWCWGRLSTLCRYFFSAWKKPKVPNLVNSRAFETSSSYQRREESRKGIRNRALSFLQAYLKGAEGGPRSLQTSKTSDGISKETKPEEM